MLSLFFFITGWYLGHKLTRYLYFPSVYVTSTSLFKRPGYDFMCFLNLYFIMDDNSHLTDLEDQAES